jgi:hypothetical protein
VILLSLSPNDRYFYTRPTHFRVQVPTPLALFFDLFPAQVPTPLALSLCYAQLEKEEGWRLALGWSPARTTGTSSSSSPTTASQEYTVSLLLSCFRWFNRSCPCSAVEDRSERGGGAQAGATRWCRLAHHPRRREHHHGVNTVWIWATARRRHDYDYLTMSASPMAGASTTISGGVDQQQPRI